MRKFDVSQLNLGGLPYTYSVETSFVKRSRFARWQSSRARRGAPWVLALWMAAWVSSALAPCCEVIVASATHWQAVHASDYGHSDDDHCRTSPVPVPWKCVSLTDLEVTEGDLKAVVSESARMAVGAAPSQIRVVHSASSSRQASIAGYPPARSPPRLYLRVQRLLI